LACNVLTNKALIFISVKIGFTNDPTVKNSSFASAANTDGSQFIRLSVKANRTTGQESGFIKIPSR